ncbi:MAG: ketoacyl-ACP synthase III [Actinomycetota bacterium]|nr:ketoacyl-ACP synthase III [Actinomycetota bacterium]
MTGARLLSLGTAIPSGVVTSPELEVRLGLTAGWIAERTGIAARHVAAPDETASSLGIAAARRALHACDLDATDIDLVITATVTPDWTFPATACLIASAVGSKAPAFDVNAGCAGFLFALAQADASIKSGQADHVLVVGTEVLSRITDPDDAKTAILFGDGAGAAVVGKSDTQAIGPFELFSDGNAPELLFVDRATDKIRMNGREVYRRAVVGMADAIGRALDASGTSPEDVDLVVAHQANARILEAVRERLDVPPQKMFSNIDRYGNTSAASIPIALAEAEAAGALSEGDLVVLAAFGAGFSWGATMVRWAPARSPMLAAAGATNA